MAGTSPGLRQSAAFISYASQDAPTVTAIHRYLERALRGTRAANTHIFLDRTDIRGGELGAEIEAALKNSDALIVVCSPRAVDSNWVAKEITAFEKFHPDGAIFPILLGGEIEAAMPAQLRGRELRYHDLRRARIVGVLRLRARDELARLAAKISDRPLRSFIDWNRRRLVIGASIAGSSTIAVGGAGWQLYRKATEVTPQDFRAAVELSWLEDEGIGRGGSISKLFVTNQRLTIAAHALDRAEIEALSTPKWIENNQFRIPKPILSLNSAAVTEKLEQSPSTAGNWVRSIRFYDDFNGSVGGLSSASALTNATIEAKLSAIGAPNDISTLGQPNSAADRQRSNERFDQSYGISAEQRAGWPDFDYAAQALPVRAKISLLLRGSEIWRSTAMAVRLREGDEDARGAHVCYFPPYGLPE